MQGKSLVSCNCVIYYLITSPLYFFNLLRPHHNHHSQPLTPAHWGISAYPIHMPDPSQTRRPLLVHHRGHSHLVYNIFVPISPSVRTHPSSHPYFHSFFFWTCKSLNSYHTAPYKSKNHLIKLTVMFWWNVFITQDIRCKPPFHLFCYNVMCTLSSISAFLGLLIQGT